MAVAPFVRVINPNDVGFDVLAVKRALVKWNKGAANGVVENNTMGGAAVALLKKFQQGNHLTADGVYGVASHTKLVPFFDAYGVSLLVKEEGLLYLDPYRDVFGLAFAGYDQGVDFSGSGKVYAAGPSVCTYSTTHSGWPGGGAVCYRFTSGKAAGKDVYLAENITPLVTVGQNLTAKTPIAVMHNAYPYTESGWAQRGTDSPMSQPISHSPTHFGTNYGALLRSVGNKHSPVQAGTNGTPLPPGWPTWT